MISEGLIIKAAKPVIDTLVQNVIIPKIKDFSKKCNLKYNEIMIPRGEHFNEYLCRTYEKYSVLNTMVFKNEQRLLKDLYIPLTLVKEKQNNRENAEKLKIDTYPAAFINKYNKILVTDTAGMGKSTLTKYLFLNIIDNGFGIPIYIEMRRLKKDRTVLMEIQEQMNSLTKDFDTKLLLEFIKTGGFVFFFDGYDEISLEDRSVVTTNVQDFVSKAGNNVFVLTSRPEQALASFGDFQVFKINPLAKEEAYELLSKYDNYGETSIKLIGELKTGQYNMIDEFLKNPLLVSLLFAAFDYKQTIPLKKHLFYRQVYDAYFDRHDLSKGDSYIHDKRSKLDVDNFDRVLRFVGFKCIQIQKIEFEKDSLLQIIDEAKSFCPDLKFGTSDFLSDILSAVPLFCQDGQYYKWVHKSLQEYFAAQFIFKDTKKNQEKILEAIYNSKHIDGYINILDIYYDIDNLGFMKNIECPLLKEYIDFYKDNIYESYSIDKKLIEERISHLYAQTICVDTCNYEASSFDSLKLTIKDKLNMTINAATFTSDGLFAGFSFQPHRRILTIMSKRCGNLFEKSTRCFPSKKTKDIKIILTAIDCHTGEEDEFTYKVINDLISSSGENYKHLNYQKCCEEVERIQQNIQKNEETLSLLEGL